ncbi:hypothetical protein WIW50_02380 [Flavobacteriaceae bacterium 3-367]
MDGNFKDILADVGEMALDSLMNNEVVKEIPILGTSLKIIQGIKNVRDKAYINKVKKFVECVGELDESQKTKLVEESRLDKKRRVKFGDALFTTIEQSESLVKVEYIAAAFEAFLNNEMSENDLRLICHVIRSSFMDELVDIVENETPQLELKYSVGSGLADIEYPNLTWDMTSIEPKYKISFAAEQLKKAWEKYKAS